MADEDAVPSIIGSEQVEENYEVEFQVGDVVDVIRRMWPGINKPGGVARITKIRYDEEEYTYTYDVAYVLGARETKIEGRYIKLLNDDGSRKRSIMGRCKYCKSFIRDCGHDQSIDPFLIQDDKTSSAAPRTKKSAKESSHSRILKHSSFAKSLVSDCTNLMDTLDDNEYISFTQQQISLEDDQTSDRMELEDFDIPFSENEDSEFEAEDAEPDKSKVVNLMPKKKRRLDDGQSTASLGGHEASSNTPAPQAVTLPPTEDIRQSARNLLTRITNTCMVELSATMNTKFINNSTNDLDLDLSPASAADPTDSYQSSILALGNTGILVGVELLGQSNLLIHSLMKKAAVVRANIVATNELVTMTTKKLSEDTTERARDLAQRVFELEDEQSTLFHTIIRVGVDVFNITIKRVHKLLRKVTKSRALSARIELLELHNNTLVDLEWRAEHDKGVAALRKLHSDFEDVFGASCYDVINNIEMPGADDSESSSEGEIYHDDGDVPTGMIDPAVTRRKERIRDSAQEAGTLRKKKYHSRDGQDDRNRIGDGSTATVSQRSLDSTGSRNLTNRRLVTISSSDEEMDGNSHKGGSHRSRGSQQSHLSTVTSHQYSYATFEKVGRRRRSRQDGNPSSKRNTISAGNRKSSGSSASRRPGWKSLMESDDEESLLYGRSTPRDKAGVGSNQSRGSSTAKKFQKQLFGAMRGSTKDKNQYSLSGEDDILVEDRELDLVDVGTHAQRVRDKFYKQVKFVKNYAGTGRVIVLEGTTPMAAAPSTDVSSKSDRRYSGADHGVSQEEPAVQSRLLNLNLDVHKVSRVNKASHSLIDTTSRVECITSSVRRLVLSSKPSAAGSEEIQQLLKSAVRPANFQFALLDHPLDSLSWADQLLGALSIECDFDVREIVDRVIAKVIAPSMMDLKHQLSAFDDKSRKSLAGSAISKAKLQSIQESLSTLLTTRFAKANACIRKLFQLTNHMMKRTTQTFVGLCLSELKKMELMMLKVNWSGLTVDRDIDVSDSDDDTPLTAEFKAISFTSSSGRLSEYLKHSRDSAGDDLLVHHFGIYFRHKIHSLFAVAEGVVTSAKLRMNDLVESVQPDENEEEADWKVLNQIASGITDVLAIVIEALLCNPRLFLGVVHCANAAQNSRSLDSKIHYTGRHDFIPGLEGRSLVLLSLLSNTLRIQEQLKIVVRDSLENKTWSAVCVQRHITSAGPHRHDHWSVLDAILCSLMGLSVNNDLGKQFDSQSVLCHVNSTGVVVSQKSKSESVSQMSSISSESVWSVISLHTYLLQRILVESQIQQSDSLSAEVLCKTTMSGDWPLVKSLCSCPIPAIAPAGILSKLLGNVDRLASLAVIWTSPVSSIDIFVGTLLSAVPTVATLPVYEELHDADVLTLLKQSTASKTNVKMDGKIAMLLCYESYASLRDNVGVAFNSDYNRVRFHEQLLVIVSSLFSVCGLVNPYKGYLDASGGGHGDSVDSDPSIEVIDSIRSAFQALLCNVLTQTNLKVNVQSGVTEILDDVRLADMTSKRLKMELKKLSSELLAIFTSHPTFVSGLLLCLLMKEVTSVLGLDWVNGKDVDLQNKLISRIIETDITYRGDTPDMELSKAVLTDRIDDQRSCLMMFVSLITFNPLPMRTNNDSTDFLSLSVSQKADMDSLHTLVRVMEMVSNMCTNNIIDEGIPSLHTKKLLLVCLSACISVLKYFASAVPDSIVLSGEVIKVPVLPVAFLKAALSMACLNIQKDFGTVRGGHCTSSVYVLCAIILFLRRWQETVIQTAKNCAKLVDVNNLQCAYGKVLDLIKSQLAEFDGLLLLVVKSAMLPLKVTCAQLVKCCNDSDESFSFDLRSLERPQSSDDIRDFLLQSSSRKGAATCGTVSLAACCHAIIMSFGHLLHMLVNRTGSSQVTYHGAVSPLVAQLPVSDLNHLKASALNTTISDFLDRIGLASDVNKTASVNNRNGSNIQHYLKSLYWDQVLSIVTCDDMDVISLLQSDPIIIPHQIFFVLMSCCALYAVRKAVLNQVRFDTFFMHLLAYSTRIVASVECGASVRCSSQVFRFAKAMVTVNSSKPIVLKSQQDFSCIVVDLMGELCKTTDYLPLEACQKTAPGSLKGKFQAEEVNANSDLIDDMFRLLRYLELCVFRARNIKPYHTLSMVLRRMIAECISFVESSAVGAFKRCLVSLDQSIIFYGEFVMNDVRTLLSHSLATQSGSLDECVPLLQMLSVYLRSVYHVSYSRKCTSWKCLLQLLLLLHKRSRSEPDASILQSVAVEVMHLWALALSLTSSQLASMRVYWQIVGDEEMHLCLTQHVRQHLSSCPESVRLRLVSHLFGLITQTNDSGAVTSAEEDSKVLDFQKYVLHLDEEVWMQCCNDNEVSALLEDQQQRTFLNRNDWMKTRETLRMVCDEMTILFESVASLLGM